MDVLRDQAEEANRLMEEDVRHTDEAQFQREADDSARWTHDSLADTHAWHDDYAAPPPFDAGGGMGFP